jgi:hypothetical protein
MSSGLRSKNSLSRDSLWYFTTVDNEALTQNHKRSTLRRLFVSVFVTVCQQTRESKIMLMKKMVEEMILLPRKCSLGVNTLTYSIFPLIINLIESPVHSWWFSLLHSITIIYSKSCLDWFRRVSCARQQTLVVPALGPLASPLCISIQSRHFLPTSIHLKHQEDSMHYFIPASAFSLCPDMDFQRQKTNVVIKDLQQKTNNKRPLLYLIINLPLDGCHLIEITGVSFTTMGTMTDGDEKINVFIKE